MATSSCIAVNNLGINELDMSSMIIYPNPAKTVLTVEGNTPLQRVEVFDCLGKLVLAQPEQGTHCTVDVAKLPPGSYLLRIVTKDGAAGTRTFLKE
jgi:hypothetical protein